MVKLAEKEDDHDDDDDHDDHDDDDDHDDHDDDDKASSSRKKSTVTKPCRAGTTCKEAMPSRDDL